MANQMIISGTHIFIEADKKNMWYHAEQWQTDAFGHLVLQQNSEWRKWHKNNDGAWRSDPFDSREGNTDIYFIGYHGKDSGQFVLFNQTKKIGHKIFPVDFPTHNQVKTRNGESSLKPSGGKKRVYRKKT